jgi:SpoVK/Ycf46/Vps4 family AAA+-type ATPase
MTEISSDNTEMTEISSDKITIETQQGIILQQGINIDKLLAVPDKNKITVKVLTELITTLEKELKTSEISQRLYDFLKDLWLSNQIKEAIDIDSIKLWWAFFLTLTKESQKKVANYFFEKYLTEKIPVERWEKRDKNELFYYINEQKNWIKENIDNIFNLDESFRAWLHKMKWIDDSIYFYIATHFLDNYDEKEYSEQIMDIQWSIDDISEKSFDRVVDFINKFWNIEGNKDLEYIFWEQMGEQQKTIIKENGDVPDDMKEMTPDLVPLIYSKKEWFTSFNAHLIELNLWVGNQLFGENHYKKIYKNTFYKIVKDIIKAAHGKECLIQNIYTSKVKDLEDRNIQKEGTTLETGAEKLHHVTERSLPEGFDEKKDLYNIWLLIKKFLPDLNLTIGFQRKYEIKALNTMNWEIKYKWLFIANSGFGDSNVVILENITSGEKRLRLALECNNVGQDELIYITSQIAYFLEHKKFLDNHQLFTEIYHRYNQIALKNTEIFNIDVLEEQYQQFFKDIVRPLTIEYQEQNGQAGKPRNSILAWIHGTGKSQFLLNLLQNKTFIYRGKEYRINCNVINMSVVVFSNLVSQDSSAFKKKLSDIYENTGIPILLAIEDLDVLINEEWRNYDIATQCITTFFDGVGSIPISVVTATNYPERISPRLLRPNRLENVIMYNMPLPAAYRRKILETHIKRNKVEEIMNDPIFKKYREHKILVDTKRFTSSHIGAFIKNIKDHIDFEREFDKDYKIWIKDIENIYNNILLSIDDIQQRQEALTSWLKLIQSKNWREKVWYKRDENTLWITIKYEKDQDTWAN